MNADGAGALDVAINMPGAPGYMSPTPEAAVSSKVTQEWGGSLAGYTDREYGGVRQDTSYIVYG